MSSIRRKIIKIDEDLCNGCGDCIPNCPEGALQIIDGKVRLISDLFCDGLGACIGHCPLDAISIEEREAESYNEKKVMENIAKQGANTIRAHLLHLKEHGEEGFLKEAINFLKEKKIEVPAEYHREPAPPHPSLSPTGRGGGCPGSRMIDFGTTPHPNPLPQGERGGRGGHSSSDKSELRQWPVQIMLVPTFAPYFKDANLLISADCVPFAYPDFHGDLLKGKILLIGCPKLDDTEFYTQKLTELFKQNSIKSITVAHMEVPCCFGLISIVEQALEDSGKKIPFEKINIGIKGEKN